MALVIEAIRMSLVGWVRCLLRGLLGDFFGFDCVWFERLFHYREAYNGSGSGQTHSGGGQTLCVAYSEGSTRIPIE